MLGAARPALTKEVFPGPVPARVLRVIDGDTLAGIISERDYARKVIIQGRASKETLVSEIMSTPVHFVTSDCTVVEAMKLENVLRAERDGAACDAALAALQRCEAVCKRIVLVIKVVQAFNQCRSERRPRAWT